MGGGAPSAPPAYQLSILDQNKYEKYAKNQLKYIKMGGAKNFQKSQVNQPNQGHQPWQSNSLVECALSS